MCHHMEGCGVNGLDGNVTADSLGSGGGGPGIDIHIHAMVMQPGMALKAEQQRLIYGGTIIHAFNNGHNNSRYLLSPLGSSRKSSSFSSGGQHPPTEVDVLLLGGGNTATAGNNLSTTALVAVLSLAKTSSSANTNSCNAMTIPQMHNMTGLYNQQTIHVVPLHHAHVLYSTNKPSANTNNNPTLMAITPASIMMGVNVAGLIGGFLGLTRTNNGNGTTNITSQLGRHKCC